MVVSWDYSSFDVFRFTYLDSNYNGGRPVIILNAKNLVEEHEKQIIISYNFKSSRMLLEPFMLVGVFFIFFIVCSVIARLDGSTSKESTTEKKAI